MIRAFISLLSISAGLVLFSFGIVFTLRHVGQTQSYTHHNHPILKESYFLIAKGGGEGEAPSNSLDAFKSTYNSFPSIWLEADLRLTKDNEWVLYGPDRLEALTSAKGRLEDYTTDQLSKILMKGGKKIIKLETLFKELPQSRYVLDIHSQETSYLKNIVALVNKYKLQDKVIIQSFSQKILDEMKKLEPQWVFGTGLRPLMKARVYTSIYLEPLASLPGDIIFSSLKAGELPPLTKRLAEEINRRQIPLVLEINDHASLIDNPIGGDIKGVMTSRPTKEILDFLSVD